MKQERFPGRWREEASQGGIRRRANDGRGPVGGDPAVIRVEQPPAQPDRFLPDSAVACRRADPISSAEEDPRRLSNKKYFAATDHDSARDSFRDATGTSDTTREGLRGGLRRAASVAHTNIDDAVVNDPPCEYRNLQQPFSRHSLAHEGRGEDLADDQVAET